MNIRRLSFQLLAFKFEAKYSVNLLLLKLGVLIIEWIWKMQFTFQRKRSTKGFQKDLPKSSGSGHVMSWTFDLSFFLSFLLSFFLSFFLSVSVSLSALSLFLSIIFFWLSKVFANLFRHLILRLSEKYFCQLRFFCKKTIKIYILCMWMSRGEIVVVL